MIDWARVSELRDEVGAEDFDELVELFLEEAAAAAGQGADVDIAAILQSHVEAREVFINQSAERLAA